jgi:hypothetical protein
MQPLKDRNYHIIGYIETKSDGTQVGKDANYRVKGYYDPKRNTTKDANYRVVSQSGNMLTTLITSP